MAHRLCRCLAQFLPVQHGRTRVILLLGIIRSAIVLRKEFSLRNSNARCELVCRYGLSRLFRMRLSILTALALPPSCIFLSCNHVQFVSSWVDLMKVRCTPILRCTAEQSMHKKTPYVTLAHAGFFALQSKHDWKRRMQMSCDILLCIIQYKF